jgi:hypothetical protein
VADLLTRRRRDIKHRSTRPAEEAIVAAAAILTPNRGLRLNKYPWQNQLWNYYRDGIGAFKYGMLWHSQTMSRVRLTAAKTMPGGDEPEPLTDGPAAEAVEQFYGGSSGQSQYMASIDLQLQIPGEGYVVGEEDPDRPGEKLWCVKSNEEMNVVSGKVGRGKTADLWQVQVDDIAGKAIENPGSALAAMPLPLKVPKEYIESFKRLEFANAFDERLMEILRFEYDNLAVAMNMPKEVMTGMGDTSHWNAWSLDEQGIETHIKPPAEGIVQGLTKTYLKPWLKAAGAPLYDSDGGEYIFWYDTSELDVPPDLSAAANDAYDRQAIDADAYRTAKGFSEGDKPDKKELREQLLLQLAKDPTNAPAAIEELTGSPVAGASTGPGGVDDGAPASQPTPATGPRVPSQPEPPANPSEPQAAAPE